eukprot:gene6631-6482_t
MRTSQFLLATQKETPSDAVVISHQLMLRAGMIRKLASGLYTWLPMGLRVMRKVEAVVREEMNAAGSLEVLMPSTQPAELWQESGRWEEYGPELLRFKDRHGRDFCAGPTHEEVITDLMRNELSSYKQLPINLYQIQTKFRDEIRPRFGLMRGREFIMKDAYSFHADQPSLQVTYDRMHQAYCNVFTRLGLKFRPVEADNGSIGGAGSHEFHVLAESGEDDIVFSNGSDYAANIEKAEAVPRETSRPAPTQELRLVDTPETKTIAALVEKFNLPIEKTIKTLVVHAEEKGKLIALIIRGDHELNEIKAANQPGVASPLVMASEAELRDAIGAGAGSLGPLNLPLPIIIDRSVELMSDFGIGANIDDKHYFGVNWERDLPVPTVADLRNVVSGDPSPDGKGTLEIKRGIEVGHIFQLGNKYSKAMKCEVLGENGKPVTLEMGCYGIGVSRVVAAAIEQNNDDKGIIWSDTLAPFQIALVPLRYETDLVREATDKLYAELTAAGFEVLLDDRDKKTSPGIKFADMELIGIPHRIVVSDRGLAEGNLEYKSRTEAEPQALPVADVLPFLQARLGGAALCGTLLVSGCANHMSQRSEHEERIERKLLDHSLQIDVGEPKVLELPQRRVKIHEQKTFEVTEFEVTRHYDRYTPYQPWREVYEIPLGAVAVVAGVGANVANVFALGNLPDSMTRDWFSYGFAGLNPFMNVQSHGRAQQNLAGIDEVQLDKRTEYSSLPWSERPVEVKAGKETFELSTDKNGVLRLNLLDSPFAEHDLNHLSKLQINVQDAKDDVHSDSSLALSSTLRGKLLEAHGLIYDDLEDDEVSQWVHRVKRLSELGLEEEATELEQSLIELTRNDPELQTEFLKSLTKDAGRLVADPGPN